MTAAVRLAHIEAKLRDEIRSLDRLSVKLRERIETASALVRDVNAGVVDTYDYAVERMQLCLTAGGFEPEPIPKRERVPSSSEVSR